MADVKHTPGPWTARFIDAQGQPVVSAEHYEVATCWHHCVGSIEKEALANARLIAAAPDLLEALKTCRSVIDQLMGDTDPHEETSALVACQRASAAIAKAENAQ